MRSSATIGPLPLPAGTPYQPLPRQSDSTACVQCPKHATTYATNSPSIDECLCGVGFYNGNSTDGRVRDDSTCVACGRRGRRVGGWLLQGGAIRVVPGDREGE